MGSPVSPVVANLYMEMFEEIAIRTAEHPPQFCVMKKTEVEAFLSHLSSIRPTIMFTMEQQKDDNLPFLDSLLHQKDDRTLEASVYRKPTHTDRYLHFSSYHPPHAKRSIVSFSSTELGPSLK